MVLKTRKQKMKSLLNLVIQKVEQRSKKSKQHSKWFALQIRKGCVHPVICHLPKP